MIDTKILISIVIVLLIGVAAASYQITTKTPGVWQPSVSQAQAATDQGSSDVIVSRTRTVRITTNLYHHHQPRDRAELEGLM